MKTAIFCVDVDSWWIYAQESGLDSGLLPEFAYQEAMPRLLEIFRYNNIKATFFVVGKDVEKLASAREFCKTAVLHGHEIANHSYSHHGRFDLLTPDDLEKEIMRTHDLIEDACNVSPTGFRAPGYFTSNQLFNTLRRCGYKYDTSELPGWSTGLMALYYRINNSENYKNKKFGTARYLLSTTKAYKPKLSEFNEGAL
jgi:peptidoglycan/xylan/chitin deacetylase (PgdA/CDA1 family)